MRFFLVFILLFIFQVSHSQVKPPVSPSYKGEGHSKFYEFIDAEFDKTKIKVDEEVSFVFSLDTVGKMKYIKIVDFQNNDISSELMRVLTKASNWDVKNQDPKGNVIIEITLFLRKEEKIKGITNCNWIKNPEQEIANYIYHKKKNTINNQEKNSINTTYNSAGVDIQPEFPGGIKEFYQFIGKNYQVPNVSGLKGKVLISFVVEKDGSLNDIKVLRDIGYGTGIEAIRVLSLSPKWIPAEQNGQHVRCKYMLPLSIEASK